MFVALVGMVVLSIIPLVWCPWSVAWLSKQAYDAHAAERYDEAIERYSEIIRRDPNNAWAHLSRGRAYQAIGEKGNAELDLRRAHELDPLIENQ
jgi:tetratricopeptide (TPR) repeat protein